MNAVSAELATLGVTEDEVRDGILFVVKGLGVHVQRMFKMSWVYTLAEILIKIFVKKLRKIWDLIYDHGLTN